MPTRTAQGSFVIVGANTNAPQVFWNGLLVAGVQEIKVDCDRSDSNVRLRIKGTEDALYWQLTDAGVTVKKVK